MALELPHSIFFHIPKTGGTWVRQAIRNADIPVNEVGGWNFMQMEDLHGYFKHAKPCTVQAFGKLRFAFVRHPLTWHQSMWVFNMRTNWKHSEFPRTQSFTESMEAMLRDYPGYVSRLYEFYSDVEYVGRYESLADDLVNALRIAEEEFDEAALRATLPVNRSASLPQWTNQCRYTPELACRVIASEKDAMERYGYSCMKEEWV